VAIDGGAGTTPGDVSIGIANTTSVTIGSGATLLGFYGGGPAARSAAYTVTSPVNTRSYDTTTVTVSTLAEVVSQILADLQANGLFQ
jgi:hypothetical protein